MIGLIDFIIVSCISLFVFAAGWLGGWVNGRNEGFRSDWYAEREISKMIERNRK